jgi:hypothetical protein
MTAAVKNINLSIFNLKMLAVSFILLERERERERERETYLTCSARVIYYNNLFAQHYLEKNYIFLEIFFVPVEETLFLLRDFCVRLFSGNRTAFASGYTLRCAALSVLPITKRQVQMRCLPAARHDEALCDSSGFESPVDRVTLSHPVNVPYNNKLLTSNSLCQYY